MRFLDQVLYKGETSAVSSLSRKVPPLKDWCMMVARGAEMKLQLDASISLPCDLINAWRFDSSLVLSLKINDNQHLFTYVGIKWLISSYLIFGPCT